MPTRFPVGHGPPRWPTIILHSFKHSRRFGIELEVGGEYDCDWIHRVIGLHSDRDIRSKAGWAQSFCNRHWHVKKDVTCGGYGRPHGWEVATPIGQSAEDLRHYAAVAECLKQDGLMVNGNCGLHVHAEIKDWREEQAGMFMAQWLRLERLVFHAVPERRRTNLHCRPCRSLIDKRKRFDAPEEVYEAFRPREVKPHHNPWRRYAINWVNFEIGLEREGKYARMTVELRLPEGSLNKNDVFNWPRLLLRLIERSTSLPFQSRPVAVGLKDALSTLGLTHESGFAVLDEDCFQLKHWLLRRLMLHSPDEALRCEANLELNSMWGPALSFIKVAPSEVNL